MHKITLFSLLTLLPLACIGASSTSSNTKLGASVILAADTATIFNGYWKVEEAQKKFSEKEEKARAELQELYNQGVALANEVQALRDKATSSALTEDAKKKFEKEAKEKEEDLRQKEVHFNEYQNSINRALTQEQENLMKTFADDVRGMTDIIRQEKVATMVLNSSGPMVISVDPKNDVTQMILDRLNANRPKSTEAVSKEASKVEDSKASAKK